MKCPSCTTTSLVKSQREGFDIDYCPSCKGMWLERGELDKIVAKISHSDPPPQRDVTEQGVKSVPSQKTNHHSPIMDSMENSRELHQLHKNGGKHHWMHRLFS